jgi:hypothetical protein
MPGSITGLPCFWGKLIQKPGLPGWGSLRNWDGKIWSWGPQDSDPRKTVLARPSNNWKLQTGSLIREGAPHQQTCNCIKIIQKGKKNWSRVPDGYLTPRQVGRLTVGHNITLTSPNACGYNWVTLFLGKINAGTWLSTLKVSQIWGSEIWSWVPWDLDPRKTVLARISSNCKVQTRPLVREGTSHQQTHMCLKIIKTKKKKKLFMGPKWVSDTKTNWPIDRQSQYNFYFNIRAF